MRNKQPKNLIASIQDRLKQIAKQNKRDVDAVLLQFFQERFLYRVSISTHAENLILKGALLLLINHIDRFRPTKDIDFLGRRFDNSPENLVRIIREIAAIEYHDGVECFPESIQAQLIKEGALYEGVRIKLDMGLGKIRKRLTLDIGFGDKLIDEPEEFEFPVLLDLPSPKIKCYHLETIIAEKFQAIVWLNFQTSRMKDFFDIYFLAQTSVFESNRLKQSIEITFNQRNTRIDRRSVVFSEEFKRDPAKQTQWAAFLKKHRLQTDLEFSTIVAALEGFLEPLFDGSLGNKNSVWISSAWENDT